MNNPLCVKFLLNERTGSPPARGRNRTLPPSSTKISCNLANKRGRSTASGETPSCAATARRRRSAGWCAGCRPFSICGGGWSRCSRQGPWPSCGSWPRRTRRSGAALQRDGARPPPAGGGRAGAVSSGLAEILPVGRGAGGCSLPQTTPLPARPASRGPYSSPPPACPGPSSRRRRDFLTGARCSRRTKGRPPPGRGGDTAALGRSYRPWGWGRGLR